MNLGFQSAEPGEHAHERLIYGLGSHERAQRRESTGEPDHDKTDHCR